MIHYVYPALNFLNNKPGFKRLMLFVLKMLTGRDFLITGTSDCWLCFNSLLVLSSSFHKWSIFIRTAGICPLKLQWWVISLTQIWGALPSTVEPDGPHDRWPQREAFYRASGSACKAVLPRNAWLQESWIVRQTYWRNWLVTKSITLLLFKKATLLHLPCKCLVLFCMACGNIGNIWFKHLRRMQTCRILRNKIYCLGIERSLRELPTYYK